VLKKLKKVALDWRHILQCRLDTILAWFVCLFISLSQQNLFITIALHPLEMRRRGWCDSTADDSMLLQCNMLLCYFTKKKSTFVILILTANHSVNWTRDSNIICSTCFLRWLKCKLSRDWTPFCELFPSACPFSWCTVSMVKIHNVSSSSTHAFYMRCPDVWKIVQISIRFERQLRNRNSRHLRHTYDTYNFLGTNVTGVMVHGNWSLTSVLYADHNCMAYFSVVT